jgi:hypothetical protein
MLSATGTFRFKVNKDRTFDNLSFNYGRGIEKKEQLRSPKNYGLRNNWITASGLTLQESP